LAPDFKFTCIVRDTAQEWADLRIELTDGRLKRHAAVTVTILDEARQDHWAGGLPDGVTQEEAEAFIWGPWELDTGAGEPVVSNRQSKPRTYSKMSGKECGLLPLRATRPGEWMSSTSQDEWRKKWKGQPIRLLVTCICDGYEPRCIQRDVKVEQRLVRGSDA